MEELSKQFVDIVRTHLDTVGIPINNCTVKYRTFEYDDELWTAMHLRIQVGDTSDPTDKTEIAIDRVGGMDVRIAIVSEMEHEGILIRREDKRYETLGSEYDDYKDGAALERVDAEIKRALPALVTSTTNKTLDWMVPEPLHKYLTVDLDNTYGDYRKDAHLDNEIRIADTMVDSRRMVEKLHPVRSWYEVRGHKDLGDGTPGRTVAKMTFRTQTSIQGTKLEAECLHIDDDKIKTDTYAWSPYGKQRIENGLPVATVDVALEDFRTMVQQKLEQRRVIADAIELPNEPQL